MLTLFPADERGTSNFGWLDSRHTFSFGDYYAPDRMGVSVLRVINDDRVTPGAGFGAHSHRDAEIISYVLDGTIEHRDSMGNTSQLKAGEFQVLTAGTGVTHSEYNASTEAELHFLQIWIWPHTRGLAPAYRQNDFERQPGRQLIASPDGRDGSLLINQDATLERLVLEPGESLPVNTDGRLMFLHGVTGQAQLGDKTLVTGDGVALTDTAAELTATSSAELLLFSLPEQPQSGRVAPGTHV